MAGRKKTVKRKKQNSVPMNMGLLITVLLICAVIIIIIAVASRNNGPDDVTDNTDSDGASNSGDIIDITDEPDDTDTDAVDTDEEETTGASDETDDTSAETETAPDTDDTTDIGNVEDSDTVNDDENGEDGDGDIIIEYPTVDPDNGADSEKLNDIIKNYMDDKIKNELPGDSADGYRYEIKSTQTMLSNDEIASILVCGEYYHIDSPGPTVFAYTLNCDIKGTALITSDNLVYDYEKIKDLFCSGKFELVYGVDGLLDETNYEDMIIQYRAEYGIYPDVYFTDDSFGMVIDLVSTLGGYARFEIPHSEVTGLVYVP